MHKNQYLPTYFHNWMEMYKKGAVTDVTFRKYELTYQHLLKLAPRLSLGSITRIEYQQLLNVFAEDHERQTVMDFHHQVKAALLDAVEEGVIPRDPTRKVVIKGTVSRKHKPKYLNQHELQKFLDQLELRGVPNVDYLLLLIAKTGLRFAEALAVTPQDVDFHRQMLNVSKTWSYKDSMGRFAKTKNKSSNRKIRIDWMLCMQLKQLSEGRPEDKPLFVHEGKRIYNSTVNDRLARLCAQADVPIISVHGLRHTHASLLLYAGVSVASVARRLGHANMSTTQSTYLHIIKELENQDNDRVMQFLSTLQ